MIGVAIPAIVRKDRQLSTDGGRSGTAAYGPATLVMLFADQAELDEIRSILNGDCKPEEPAPTGIRHAWLAGLETGARADEEARDPSCRLGGDHRCREADGSPLTVIDGEVSFGSVCAEWARRDSRPEDAA